MKLLELKLVENNKWIAKPTIENINEMFSFAEPYLNLDLRTSKNKVRRISQMKWSTVAKEVRMKRKRLGSSRK